MRKVGVALALALAGCAPLTEPSTASTSLPSVPGEAIATTSSLPSPMPGAAGIGDRLYPWLGNGGYDVEAYDIRLFFDPDTGESGWATGSVEITAVALQDLTQFNLDFVGLTVTEVVGLQGIAQTALPYRREGRELTIDPDGYIPSGTRFVISVSWEGSPGPVPQQAAPFQPGWQRGPDSYYAFSQPDGAAGWFPGNDHPRDRADVLLQVEVPMAYQAVGTGTPYVSEGGDGGRLWRFRLANVAPYQIPLAVGHFEQRTSVEDARTYLLWFDLDLRDDPRLEMFGLQADITGFFESWFGPYPYQTVGALVVEDDVPAALETVEIATYTSLSLQAGHEIVAHEISHQWFGNWITLDQWEDIWLNEGLATFAQWLWLERHEGRAAYDRAVESAYRRLSGLDLIDEGMTEAEARQRTMEAFPPPSRPRADSLFNPSVYLRGGLAFVALRDAVGDEPLKAFLGEYVDRFGGQGVTEEDLLGLITEHFGDEAGELLTAWSADPQIPTFRGLSAP